jgi:8-oxo-dGTP pyrophosphatase MutT (NUDIX family)
LLAKRADWLSRHPSTWAAPGGGIKRGESRFAAALREVEEELGLPAEDVELRGCFFVSIHVSDPSPFTMFVAEIDQKWVARTIRLNEENTAAAWFPLLPTAPPRGLHPGMRSAWKLLCEEASSEEKTCFAIPASRARLA